MEISEALTASIFRAEKFFYTEHRNSASFRKSVNFYEPTRLHIPEDSDFHLYRRQNIEYRLGSALFSEICFKSFLHLRPHFSSSVFSSYFLTKSFYAFLVRSYLLHVSPLLLSKLLHSRFTFKTSQQFDIEHYQILFALLQILLKNNKLCVMRFDVLTAAWWNISFVWATGNDSPFEMSGTYYPLIQPPVPVRRETPVY